MPFSSKKQSAACFATGGFGGKVDCEEWAHKTKYKTLPKKKFKEWLEKAHPDYKIDEAWYNPMPAIKSGLQKATVAGAIGASMLGAMPQTSYAAPPTNSIRQQIENRDVEVKSVKEIANGQFQVTVLMKYHTTYEKLEPGFNVSIARKKVEKLGYKVSGVEKNYDSAKKIMTYVFDAQK